MKNELEMIKQSILGSLGSTSWTQSHQLAVKLRLPASSRLPAMGKENILRNLSDLPLSHWMRLVTLTLPPKKKNVSHHAWWLGDFFTLAKHFSHHRVVFGDHTRQPEWTQDPYPRISQALSCKKWLDFSVYAQSLCPWWARIGDKTWAQGASNPKWIGTSIQALAGVEKL